MSTPRKNRPSENVRRELLAHQKDAERAIRRAQQHVRDPQRFQGEEIDTEAAFERERERRRDLADTSILGRVVNDQTKHDAHKRTEPLRLRAETEKRRTDGALTKRSSRAGAVAPLSDDVVSVIGKSADKFFRKQVGGVKNFLFDELLEMQKSCSSIRLQRPRMQLAAMRYAGAVRRAAEHLAEELSKAVGVRQRLGHEEQKWIKTEVEKFITEKTSETAARAFFEYAISDFDIRNEDNAKDYFAEAVADIAGGSSLISLADDKVRHLAAIFGHGRTEARSTKKSRLDFRKNEIAYIKASKPGIPALGVCRLMDQEQEEDPKLGPLASWQKKSGRRLWLDIYHDPLTKNLVQKYISEIKPLA